MALHKHALSCDAPSVSMKPSSVPTKVQEKVQYADSDARSAASVDVDVDLGEVYFLIMHFLSAGPCQRTYGQLWNELLQHHLLPRRYHAWYSRNGVNSNDENDDGLSLPLSYNKLVERYPHVGKDHLVKLLKQLIARSANPSQGGIGGGHASNAADVPTLMGTGSFSLLECDRNRDHEVAAPPVYMRWPHMRADQLRGLALREIGGGFAKHHRAPSTRAACYAIAKPSTLVQKMQQRKPLRGHRNAVYCAIFDRLGRYVVTGSDDRLVKIWSMETAYCLASCRGHEGDITDLAVNYNNAVVASSSNDCIIRVWRLPDGHPISVLRGHTCAVTAIAFSPRPNFPYQLLSSADDGTCRIWDARLSQCPPRIYVPKPPESVAGKSNGPSTSAAPQNHQIFCCAFNANGTVFVTGSSDTFARVWSAACKPSMEDSEHPNHEMDVLAGHENDVNYVQFSGCAVAPKFLFDASKEDNISKFKNSWFTHDNIVTCSRDGSAIIWIPRSRRSHGKVGRWTRAYHLKVPPPPMPPQPPRGGPRQRILPTPRGVNMIVWSLDNRFVLAAIMDCRICVWNAVDGSLVHSLTGHGESTYVLDVHPFNPRIAMSAGYDGKTIVWDIWEGKPVHTYDIGRFKLVDGKFSPDGTSIILSDDVGQLCILGTGQGDSQKDAKYDQFFLGDYRPLARDTNGNVIDQETQLVPYRRNMQDLLCDSGMIPYPEPYQSVYQRRRLGAMGKEWRPHPVRLAVGTDITLDQDYHMLPLVDLDIPLDPLPEFLDAIDWEPDIEVQSDDNDSEYNVTEEYSNGREQQSLSSNSSGDPECSAGDSETGDGLRRSKRKKRRKQTATISSSGRPIKRRNLDACESIPFKNARTKKTRIGLKKQKSSGSKSRPRRAAARNALTLFSRITGTSTTDEEDEYGSEGELTDSESSLQESDVGSDEFVGSSQDEQCKSSRSKEVQFNESVDLAHQLNKFSEPRQRLILKLPIRDSGKLVPRETTSVNGRNEVQVAGSLSKAPKDVTEVYRMPSTFDDSGVSAADTNCSSNNRNEGGQLGWGGVKARSSKRLRFGESIHAGASIGCNSSTGGDFEVEDNVENFFDFEKSHPEPSRHLIHYSRDANSGGKGEGSFGLAACHDHDKSGYANPSYPNASPVYCNNAPAHPSDVNEKTPPIPTKLRIKSRTLAEDDWNSGSDASSAGHSEAERPENIDFHIGNSAKFRKNKARFQGICWGEGSTSNMSNHHFTSGTRSCDVRSGVVRKTRSTREQIVRSDGLPHEERVSRPRRNKSSNFHTYAASPPDGRKMHQPTGKLSWLMLSIHEEGSQYIPQKGDEVAYLRQGHLEYLVFSHSSENGPWASMQEIKAVEFCQVEELEYASSPGSGESCCKMILRFVDPTSVVFQNKFRLTLPEVNSFPDFLVERSHYEAAIRRNWTNRDRCRVWWRNEGDEHGSWWEGRITGVKCKSPEFPDSPWERYGVQYKSDPGEMHQHCPWELYDVDNRQRERPCIDDESRNKLLSFLAELEKTGNNATDPYGVHVLQQVSQKSKFINRFPVPVSLEVIRSRLENNYYRRIEAMEHDVEVMLENARSYYVKKLMVLSKLEQFLEWFTRSVREL